MAIIPNATITLTHGTGTVVYSARRVQYNALEANTAPILPSGAPAAAVIFDTADASGGYARGDVVDVQVGPPDALAFPDPHKFRVASSDPISSRTQLLGVRILLEGLGR